ncbi:MAG: PEGA domain-containing protein [Polyangiaceae bacterium]
MMRYLLIAFLSASLLLVTAIAAAKPVRDDLTGEALVHWDAAMVLYRNGSFNGAIVEFDKAYAESKNPRVLFNIGVCWKNLERYAKAVRVWQKQLEQRAELDEADIKSTEKAIELVSEYVSTLAIKSNVPGAEIVVQDEVVGRTPLLEPVAVDVGPVTVRLRKDGYIAKEQVVNVVKGTPAEATIDLEKEGRMTPVSINITGAPKASIFIDGTEMGEAPFSGEVPAGRHTFEARAAGFETARQTSEVAYGEPFNITLSLVVELREGKLKIITGFEDAVIEVDGKVVGQGAWEGNLDEGGHRVIVKKDGYEEYVGEVALSPGQERKVRITLEPERDNAWIYWTITSVAVVAGASVASYFVFKPTESSQVTGTLNPGVVPTLLSW